MAHVIGNSGRVFPNSHSGRLTADNPASQHRISAIKTGDVNKLLIYVSFFAVPAGRAFQYRTVFYQLNIGAFAGEYRLFTISSQFSGFGIGPAGYRETGGTFRKAPEAWPCQTSKLSTAVLSSTSPSYNRSNPLQT